MASRRKRKRERRKAEATANTPRKREFFWGSGEKFVQTWADLALVGQAVNGDWPVAHKLRQALVDELGADLEKESHNARRILRIVRMFLAMDRANLRSEVSILKLLSEATGSKSRSQPQVPK